MKKYDDIQLLRAVAAISVVLDHGVDQELTWSPAIKLPGMLFEFAGYMGVWIFFIISGFIMFITQRDNFGAPGSTVTFLKSRLIRIWPLYALATTVYIGFVFHKVTFIHYIESLTFFPYFNSEGLMRPILGVGWTLNYEMFFYLMFAVALMFSFWRGLFFLSIVMCSLVSLTRVIPDDVQANDILRTYTDPMLLLFLGGVLIGLLRSFCTSINLKRPLIAIFILFFLLFPMKYLEIHSAFAFKIYVFNILYYILTLGIVACAVFSYHAYHNVFIKIGLILGDMSYSLYLSHVIVIYPLAAMWRRYLSYSVLDLPYMLLSLAIAIVAAYFIFTYVEMPMTRFLRKRLPPSHPKRGN